MLLTFCSILSLETTESTSTRCGESVLLQELKVKISELEEALNLSQKAIANLTTQVNAVKHV